MSEEKKTLSVDKITEQIEVIVIEWNQGKDWTPEQILKQYKRLSGYLWLYASHVASFKSNYNRSYFIRKIAIARSTQGMMVSQKLAKNKADIEALLKHEAEYEAEIEAEASAYAADLLLRQGNKIADCMRSELSFIKKEMEQSPQQT